ncbi:hypothetical protein OQA88_2701 [Cercophora sp. LCS_1]
MVKLTDITHANAALKSLPPLTAVVVGGTNGIGLSFLTHLTKTTTSPKIYIIGRDASSLTSLVATLQSLNSSGTYIPITTPDLTLVRNAQTAALEILNHEPSHIDILYLSPGYLTFARRDESPEGLDRPTALRYYSRLRIILTLLPLLSKAPQGGRVIDVLGGGQEGAIFPDDLALKESAHTNAITAASAAGTYTTLVFEELAKQYPRVSFVHTFPGVVRTKAYQRPEHLGPVARILFNWVMFPLFGWLFETGVEEAGARTLYAATSSEFGPRELDGEGKAVGSDGEKGSGAYTVNEKSEVVRNEKVLGRLREEGLGSRIWEFTVGEFERILGN